MSAAEAGASPQGRRDLIIEKAAELLARKGISATTVREISDAAGILSGSLYHHFDSKDAIVDVVMSAYLDDLIERYRVVMDSTSDVKEMFQGLVYASLRAVAAHPSATVIYQHDAHYFRETPRFRYVRVGAEQVRKTWMTALEAGVEEGVFRSDMPAKYFYLLLRDGLWLSIRWFRPTTDYGFEELAADCCRLYYQAFASPDSLQSIVNYYADETRGPRSASPAAVDPVSRRGRKRAT